MVCNEINVLSVASLLVIYYVYCDIQPWRLTLIGEVDKSDITNNYNHIT